MKKLPQHYLLFLFLIVNIPAMTQNRALERAETEFELRNYTEAVKWFEQVLNSGKYNANPSGIYLKMAESFFRMKKYTPALEYFHSYFNFHPETNPEIMEKYANLLLITGNVHDARKWFVELLQSDPHNPELKRMIECCDFAMSELALEGEKTIRNQELINSPESDFAPVIIDDKLIFSSQKIINDNRSLHGRTSEGFSDIYSADYDPALKLYKNPVAITGNVNSPLNEGTFTYNKYHNYAFFTRCTRNPELCRIYRATLQNDRWVDVKEVDFGFKSANFAHPCLSTDGKTLYFTADLPGGMGGKDIWKATIGPGAIPGKPVNLGEMINTSKDELFPRLHNDSLLFFASEGHVGMGGLDIFYSRMSNKVFGRPENPGAPINSTNDDFGLYLNSNGIGGMFCSNRNYSTASDDIFSFDFSLFEAEILGEVVDSLTMNKLQDVQISWTIDNQPAGVVYSDKSGKFKIIYPLGNHELKLTASLDGYQTKTVIPDLIYRDLQVIVLHDGSDQHHGLKGSIYEKDTGKPVSGVQITVKSLRGLEDTTFTDLQGNYTFEKINPDDYLVVRASKTDYLNDSRTFQTPGISKRLIMSVETGYDTDFELIPVVKDVEFNIENIYYEFDKAALLPESRISLDKLVNLLLENPLLNIQINSHADERGSDQYNMELSNLRSASVVNYLISAGISYSRLASRGYGETELVVKNATTEEEHQKNRRTTFEITGDISRLSGLPTVNTTFSDNPASPRSDVQLLEKLKSNSSVQDKLSDATSVVSSGADSEPASVQIASPSPGKAFVIQILAGYDRIIVESDYPQLIPEIQKYGLSVVEKDQIFKYRIGRFSTKTEAEEIKKILVQKGMTDCFITAE